MRRKRKRKARLDLIVAPFTVVIDTREQKPWSFQGLKADAKDKYVDLVVPTKRAMLRTGDYSILGMEDEVTVERKSLDDAFGTFGEGRERWERELERLKLFRCATIIVEAGWPSILSSERPVAKSGHSFSPKMFYRSVISWQVKFPNVQWWPCPTAYFAERTCFRILDRYWRLIHE